MKEALKGLPGILVSLCHPRGCLTVFRLYFISAHIQMPRFPAGCIFSVLPYYFTKFIPNWNAIFKVVWDSRLNSKAIYCSIVKPFQSIDYYYCKHPEPRGSLKILEENKQGASHHYPSFPLKITGTPRWQWPSISAAPPRLTDTSGISGPFSSLNPSLCLWFQFLLLQLFPIDN